MQVLLTHAVPHFGQPGDLVKVRPGFARNYLLPQGLATFATPHNLRIVEKHRQRLRELEEARRADLAEPRRADRPALDHHRGQRQRRGPPLRLGQRRPDRRGPADRAASRSTPTTSRSRGRSRSWASTPSSSTWARTSPPRSSSGSSRRTPRNPPEPIRPPDDTLGWQATDARPGSALPSAIPGARQLCAGGVGPPICRAGPLRPPGLVHRLTSAGFFDGQARDQPIRLFRYG